MAETPAPTTTTSTEFVTTLPKTLIQRLEAEAKRQALSVDALINEAIEIYLDELEDDEEYEDTPDEEILADFRQAWHEAMTGDVIPADEALAQLRRTLANED